MQMQLEEPSILNQLLPENITNQIRTKQLLYFLLGYSISQLNNLYPKINTIKRNSLFTIKNIAQIYQLVQQKFQLKKKRQIVEIFTNLLSLFNTKFQSKSTFYKNLNNENFILSIFVSMIKSLDFQKFKNRSKNQDQLRSLLETQFNKEVQKLFNQGQSKQKIVTQENQSHIIIESKQANQKLSNESKLSSLQQNTQILNQENQLCQVCYYPLQKVKLQDLPLGQIPQIPIKLSSCQHQYHFSCLHQIIKQYMKDNNSIIAMNPYLRYQTLEQSLNTEQGPIKTLIKCPNHDQCQQYFLLTQVHDILSQFHPNNIENKNLQLFYNLTFHNYLMAYQIQKFQQQFISNQDKMAINKNLNPKNNNLAYFYCRTLGCNAVYQIDKYKSLNFNSDKSEDIVPLENYICQACRQAYCLKCFCPVHPKMSCKQYAISTNYLKEDEQFEKFITTLKKPYKKCPKCKFYVENWRGCSTVKCRCGIQFCYKCGNIGCPHAKCLKQTQKQAKQKELKQKQALKKNT